MPKSCILMNFLLVIFGLVCVYVCKCSGNVSESNFIGQCDDGSDNCSMCYQTLVKSLISKDKNLFNLSRSFSPTNVNNNDRPQFVIITYQFKNINDTKILVLE